MSKVTTKNEVRLSYTNLIAPRAQDAEKPDVLTYSTAILIPKSDKALIANLKSAIKEALAEGVAKKWGGKTPPKLKNPLRDGDVDRPDDDIYKGCMFLNAKGPRGGAEQPILMDSKGNATESYDVIYSGVYARVSVQFYPFDKNGNRGVAAGLTSVLSMEHGEPLGNIVTIDSARNEFGVSTSTQDAAKAFEDDESNESNESSAGPSEDDEDPWFNEA